MNPPPEGRDPAKHADHADLTATDALLDRLGGRDIPERDLDDPIVAALIDLVAAIDDVPETDVAAARLLEVLGGRPLYIAGPKPDAAQFAADLSAMAELRLGRPEDGTEQLVIDLTDSQPAEPAEVPAVSPVQHGPLTGLPRPSAAVVVPLRRPEPRVRGPHHRLVTQFALPAASVVVLAALGGGVSAAVTGDPMTAVHGISRVVSSLPGVANSRSSSAEVKEKIEAANQAAAARNAPEANQHLAAARRGLADVPDSDKTHLNQLIDEVETRLDTSEPTSTQPTSAPVATSPTTADAPTAPTAPIDPSPTPSASSSPSVLQPTASAPDPTPEPGPEPEPTPVQIIPAPEPTTDPPVEPETRSQATESAP